MSKNKRDITADQTVEGLPLLRSDDLSTLRRILDDHASDIKERVDDVGEQVDDVGTSISKLDADVKDLTDEVRAKDAAWSKLVEAWASVIRKLNGPTLIIICLTILAITLALAGQSLRFGELEIAKTPVEESE